MVSLIMWVSLVGVGLCVLVFLTIVGVVVTGVINYWRQRCSMGAALPYPDTSAERMYDVQYFYRANGRTDK
jgi:hypothetical protein